MDLISREAALDCFHDWIDRHGDVHTPDEMAEYIAIEALPFVESEKRTEERTETHACDCISRQAAITDIQKAYADTEGGTDKCAVWKNVGLTNALHIMQDLPSAQSEIVRCGQCKYAEVADAQDNQDGYTCQFHRGSIWFSGSYCSWGERKSDEQV